ncbi:MAG: hypothetical protein JOZ95_25705 [Solirubrobacterales bacterium]|nr:hypothetical protein [Solirubrobacterales bacterium]
MARLLFLPPGELGGLVPGRPFREALSRHGRDRRVVHRATELAIACVALQ